MEKELLWKLMGGSAPPTPCPEFRKYQTNSGARRAQGVHIPFRVLTPCFHGRVDAASVRHRSRALMRRRNNWRSDLAGSTAVPLPAI
jgi:hypothetical protein